MKTFFLIIYIYFKLLLLELHEITYPNQFGF